MTLLQNSGVTLVPAASQGENMPEGKLIIPSSKSRQVCLCRLSGRNPYHSDLTVTNELLIRSLSRSTH
jgi:hypothetical protein